MSFRCYSDNVAIQLEPLEVMTNSGLHLPQRTERGALGFRFARVVASGPGYFLQKRGGANGTLDGAFVANETRPGDRVLLPALSGTNFDMDLTIPRHNKGEDFKELFGDKGEFRIVRESEILAIVEVDGG
jgi:co-chaperonin GroES (HSP10)